MKKVGFILLLIFIFLIVVGGIIGIYYVKGNDTEEKEAETITYEVTDQKIQDVLDIFQGPGCAPVVEEFLNDHKVVAGEVSSNIAMAVPWHRGDLGEQTEISLEQYTKYVQKYFGEDYSFQPKEGEGLLCIWKYDASKKAMVKNLEAACGCTGDPGYTRYRVSKAIEKNHVLEIDLRVAFYRVSTNSFYADYEATRSLPELVIDGMTFYDSDEAYAKASLYRMTFKESDGNYIFVSAEEIK